MPVQRLYTKQWITARVDQSVAFSTFTCCIFVSFGKLHCGIFSATESVGGCRAAGPALEVVPDAGGVRSPEGAAGGATPELSQPAGLLHQPADTQHAAAGDCTAQFDFCKANGQIIKSLS